MSAPDLFIDAIELTFHSSSPIHPCIAAAFIIAYSPDTFCTAIGKSKFSFIMQIISRDVIPGFIITMSAPSSMSVSTSLKICRGFVYDTWYDDLSITLNLHILEKAADLNGVYREDNCLTE